MSKSKKSKKEKKGGKGVKTTPTDQSTPDVRDLDRELAHCLETPNRRDPECVRLIIDHVVANKLRLLEKNSRLGEANKALLAEAMDTLIRLTI